MDGRFAVLVVCLLISAPARAAGHPSSPPPQTASEGEVYVYLQPLPAEAERLGFSIASAAAVTDQGSDVPLALSLKTVTPREVKRQRLLASGRLPAGGYAAVSIKIRNASLRRDTGEAALHVPDSAVRADVAFVVPREKALVLWLEFRADASLAGSVVFSPVFSAVVAPRPMLSLAGFVSNSQSNSITVFDKKLRQASAVIPTGDGPAGMALDRQAGRLYVACPSDDEVQSIDVAAAEVVDRARLFPGDEPRELALTPDGRTLVSVNSGSNSISFFETAPLTRVERIPVGSGPGAILIDPAGRRAFVFNTLSSSVSVVDIARRSVVATVSLDSSPLRGQFSGRGDRIFVIHERSPYVSVIDPLRLTIVTRARLRIGITAIKVDDRRNVVYVAGRDDTMIEFYDPGTLLPIDSMNAGGGVSHLAIDAEDNSLYAVSPDTGRLVIFSLAERKVVSEIDVGKGPYWVAVMGER